MKEIKKGSTSITEYFNLVDKTAGTAKTAVAEDQIYLSYVRNRSTLVASVCATLASGVAAFSAFGAFEVDATNAPGLYRVDVPDAAFASGVDKVILSVIATTTSSVAPAIKEVMLVDQVANDVYTIVATVGAAVDWAKILNKSTSNDLSGTFISRGQTITAVLGNVAGSVGSVVGNVGGSVGSVVGNVGGSTASVVGNVGGSVSSVVGGVGGAVGSVVGNVGGTIGGFASGQGPRIRKNVALANFMFLMTDSTNHAPSTGLTVTCTRSIDGGAFAAGTITSVAEVSSGWYKCNFGAGDLNGDVIAFRATAASSDDRDITIITNP